MLKKKLSQQGTMTSSFSGSKMEKWYKRVTKKMMQTILVDEYLQGMLQQRALTAPLDDGMTMETTARVSNLNQAATEQALAGKVLHKRPVWPCTDESDHAFDTTLVWGSQT